jgi:hypothetical protein
MELIEVLLECITSESSKKNCFLCLHQKGTPARRRHSKMPVMHEWTASRSHVLGGKTCVIDA